MSDTRQCPSTGETCARAACERRHECQRLQEQLRQPSKEPKNTRTEK